MKYIVCKNYGANFRNIPSTAKGKVIEFLKFGTVINNFGDVETVKNTAGGVTTTYRLVEYNGAYGWISDTLISKVDNIVNVSENKITLNGLSFNVFNQHKRPESGYKKQISDHGCGASVTTFAVNLYGAGVTVENVVEKALKKWGMFNKHILFSANGIATMIKDICGVNTKFSATKDKDEIKTALKNGKQVVFMSHTIFSSTYHYSMAVGFDKKGKVVVANSGNRGPVNVVSFDDFYNSIVNGNGKDKKWYTSVTNSAGIVIVG